jgi:hypothetical protein
LGKKESIMQEEKTLRETQEKYYINKNKAWKF